eukprot:313619-Chlamydomonas_euryale.AAC.1
MHALKPLQCTMTHPTYSQEVIPDQRKIFFVAAVEVSQGCDGAKQGRQLGVGAACCTQLGCQQHIHQQRICHCWRGSLTLGRR